MPLVPTLLIYSTITLAFIQQDIDKDDILEDASNVHCLINKISIVIISTEALR